MFKPRPYQERQIKIGYDYLTSVKNGRGSLVACTASGKSWTIAGITAKLDAPTIILCPNKEILEQNKEKYDTYGFDASFYSASVNEKIVSDTTFATIQSVYKKPKLFKDFKYVLIDESHLTPPSKSSMYNKFIKGVKPYSVLGLTATPLRMKKYSEDNGGYFPDTITKAQIYTQIRPKFWKDILDVVNPNELYENDWLSPIKMIPLEWDGSALLYNSTGADFDSQSIEKSLLINKVNAKIPYIIKQAQRKGRKSHLVFVNSVKDAVYLQKKVPNSAVISSDTKKEDRNRIVKEFKRGIIKVIFNFGTLTTGFNHPELDNIIVARPLLSLILWSQIIGRGVRKPEDKNSTKKDCTVVDMCDNYRRFGNPQDWVVQKYKGKWQLFDSRRFTPLTNRDLKTM